MLSYDEWCDETLSIELKNDRNSRCGLDIESELKSIYDDYLVNQISENICSVLG